MPYGVQILPIYGLKTALFTLIVLWTYLPEKIAWTFSDTMEVSTVVATIDKAKIYHNTESPLIIHSDRGSQYVSNAWREATKTMQRNYSRCAYPYDNACIESFHSLIKREWLNIFSILPDTEPAHSDKHHYYHLYLNK